MKTSLLVSSAVFALGTGWGGTALAQTAPAEAGPVEDAATDRIIVTAQKQAQDLLDVPINISVADQDQLDLLGADDIEEFGNFVPGLQVQAQSLNTSSYSLRGVTSDGGRPRVALFENGVAIGQPRFGANTAMFDLERIEVVKGPQATLFGQGALVGGINFLQNKASLAGEEGWVKVDGGEYGYLRAEAGYNFVLGDTLALRAAAMTKSRDGYAPNLVGEDLMGQATSAYRVAAAWEPADRLRADLWLNYQRDDSTGTAFKSGVFPAPGGDTGPFTPAALNITQDQMRDKLGADRELASATLNVEFELNDAWTLTSLSNARVMENLEAFDADGSAYTILQFGTLDQAQTWSQELRMNFDNGGPVTGFFGANYYTQDQSVLLRLSTDEARGQAFLRDQLLAGFTELAGFPVTVDLVEGLLEGFGVPGAMNFDNIDDPLRYSAAQALLQYLDTGSINTALLVPLHDRHIEEQFSGGKQTNYDIFADATWEVTDRLSVTGGLRYTWDELESNVQIYLVRGNPALGGDRNAVTLGTTIVAEDSQGVPSWREYETDGELTWRFNAAYRISDTLNAWAAVGRGRRPPSLSARDCVAGPGCDAEVAATGFEIVDQEIYDNYEIGLTGEFLDSRLRLSSSAYYGEYADFQTTRFDVDQGSFISENSGNATSWGVELDSFFEASDFLDLYATYTHAVAEYDDTDSDGQPLQFAGNVFRLSPENSFSIAADFHFPVANGAGEVFFVPSYVWKDDHFFEDDNDPWEFQKAYGLLNMKLGYAHGDGTWGASLYVENALDEDYLIDAGNTGGEFGIPTYIRGVPRMIGAGAWVKF